MNAINNMKTTAINLTFQPVKVPRSVPLSVHFAADFPVEFTIQRLEDVPLRTEPRGEKMFPAACQQT
jgi:hypothetical protein